MNAMPVFNLPWLLVILGAHVVAFSNDEYNVQKKCYQAGATPASVSALPLDVLRHSTGPREDSIKIRLAQRGWLTHAILYHVYKIILEELVGLTNVSGLDLTQLSFDFGDIACSSGDCPPGFDGSTGHEVDVECWWMYDFDDAKYKKFVQVDRSVLDAGSIGFSGISGIYFAPGRLDASLSRGYGFYAMHRNKEVHERFPRVGTLDLVKRWGDKWNNDPTFCGDEWNRNHRLNNGTDWCTSGRYLPPQCLEQGVECNELYKVNVYWDAGYIEQLLKNNGLLYGVSYISPNYTQIIAEFSRQNQPVLYFWWQPDPLHILINGVRVSFPIVQCTRGYGDFSSPDGTSSCDFPLKRLAKATSTTFRAHSPIAYHILENLQVTSADIDTMMSRHVDVDAGAGRDAFAVACEWIRSNELQVLRWVPQCGVGALFDTESLRCMKLCPPHEIPMVSEPSCRPCSIGEEPHEPGLPTKRVCRKCRAGYYNPSSNQTSCSLCPAGRAQPEEGQATCDRCLMGRFSPAPETGAGNIRCFQCEAGRYQPHQEQELCMSCSRGYYSELGAAHCSPCTRGRFTNIEGASACASCSPGRSQHAEGKTTCSACSAGRYQSSLGQSECESCPHTLITWLEGAERAEQCMCHADQYMTYESTDSGMRPQCSSCVEGLHCSGKSSPAPLPKFMFVPEEVPFPPAHISVYRCRSEKHCPGTSSLQGNQSLFPSKWAHICGGGHVGIACASCPDGFYEDADKEDLDCTRCVHSELRTRAILLCLMCPFLAWFIYYNFNRRQEPIKKVSKEANADKTLSERSVVGQTSTFKRNESLHLTPSEKSFLQGVRKQLWRQSMTAVPNVISHYITSIRPPPLVSRLWHLFVTFGKEVIWVARDCFDTLLQFAQVVAVLQPMVEWLDPGLYFGIDVPSILQGVRFVNLEFTDMWQLLRFPRGCFLSKFAWRFGTDMALPLAWAGLFFYNASFYKVAIKPMQKKLRKHFAEDSIMGMACNLQITLDRTLNAIGTQTLLLFIGISSNAFSLFVCDPNPSADSTVRRYPEIVCMSKEWDSVLPLGICALCVYTLGFIAFISYILYISPMHANEPRFRARYFFLFAKLKPDVFWWRIIVTLKTLLLQLIVTLFTQKLQFLVVLLVLLHMVSLSFVFVFRPWNDQILTIIDSACQICIILLLSCISFHLSGTALSIEDVHRLIGPVEVLTLKLPLVVTLLCTFIPLYRFMTKLRHKVHRAAFTQRFRDASLLITRHTTEELIEFVHKLNAEEMHCLSQGLNTVYARMYKVQPAHRWHWRLIKDASSFTVRTVSTPMHLLVDAIRAGRAHELQSLEETSLLHYFLEVASGIYSKKYGHLPTAASLFKMFDVNNDGTLTRVEFVYSVAHSNGMCCQVTDSEAAQVFNILSSNGCLTQGVFCAAILGMTYHKGLLRLGKQCNPQEVQEHEVARQQMSLACMLAAGECGSGVSSELERRARNHRLNSFQRHLKSWLRQRRARPVTRQSSISGQGETPTAPVRDTAEPFHQTLSDDCSIADDGNDTFPILPSKPLVADDVHTTSQTFRSGSRKDTVDDTAIDMSGGCELCNSSEKTVMNI